MTEDEAMFIAAYWRGTFGLKLAPARVKEHAEQIERWEAELQKIKEGK